MIPGVIEDVIPDEDFDVDTDPLSPSHLAWMDKAHQLIGTMCRDAYKAHGSRRGYRVPRAAAYLVSCIGKNAKEAAQAAFLRLNDGVPADDITWPDRA